MFFPLPSAHPSRIPIAAHLTPWATVIQPPPSTKLKLSAKNPPNSVRSRFKSYFNNPESAVPSEQLDPRTLIKFKEKIKRNVIGAFKIASSAFINDKEHLGTLKEYLTESEMQLALQALEQKKKIKENAEEKPQELCLFHDANKGSIQSALTVAQLNKTPLNSTKIDFSERLLRHKKVFLEPNHPLKALTLPLRKKGGRNNHGHITVRHRGGGFKRRIRLLHTQRDTSLNEQWRVVRIEHDPNRSAKIALLQRVGSPVKIPPSHQKEIDPLQWPVEIENVNDFRYVIQADGMTSETIVTDGIQKVPSVGSCMPLGSIPPGTLIHSIESRPGYGGRICRAAGTKATLVNSDPLKGKSTVKLPSGKLLSLPSVCTAVIGQVGNIDWQNRVIGTAGRNRRLGKRPRVRGVAMNPIDHPHGGGSGGRNKGHLSQSPWGWLS